MTMQGWSEGNDIRRYLLLLAQTGLLGAAGFALSHLVRETNGARIFFGLALVSIPANFTILGALLYSVFQWDGGLTTDPSSIPLGRSTKASHGWAAPGGRQFQSPPCPSLEISQFSKGCPTVFASRAGSSVESTIW